MDVFVTLPRVCDFAALHLLCTVADTVNCFKSRLDKFWSNQEVYYNYKADLHGTGNRSIFFVILKFYPNIYSSDTEACQGLHLLPLCDVMGCDVM